MRHVGASIVLAGIACGQLAFADNAHDKAMKRRDILDRRKAAAAAAPPPVAGALAAPAPPVAGAELADAKLVAVSANEVYQSSHCAEPLVVCYTREGVLVDDDAWPTTARPGDKLTVVVITNVAADQDTTTVSFAGHKSDESLFPVDSDLSLARDINVTFNNPVNYIPLSFTSDAIAADSVELSIDFTRTDPDPKLARHSSHRIDVDLGYSYFSVALLVAATYKADRHVLRDLSTVSDHAVDPGLALNVFPGGRQRGVIGYIRRCSSDFVLRCIANTVGIQIATSLDLTSATDRLYAGIVFEPIAGLGLVGGVSLRKVDVVPTAGGLPSIEAMDGSSPLDRRYVVRGYVGFTFTVDLLTTIAQAGSDIRKLATQ